MQLTFFFFFCLYKIIDLMKIENSGRLEERLNRKKKKQKTKNQSINQPNPTSDHLHRERLSSTRKGNVLSLSNGLEAFAVNDSGAGLVVLLLGDPQLLEGGEGSPDGVFPLGRSDDLDLHGGRSQGGDLLLHTIGDTGVHGGAAGKDGVGVEILAEIDVR